MQVPVLFARRMPRERRTLRLPQCASWSKISGKLVDRIHLLVLLVPTSVWRCGLSFMTGLASELESWRHLACVSRLFAAQ